MATHLVWFRNDLRLTDNLALHAACQDPQAIVMAVFIATPAQWAAHDMAPRQAAFLLQNLQLLQSALAERGIPLHYHQCDDFKDSITWLNDFCQQQPVDALFYNQQYELNERVRDEALMAQLSQRAIACHGFHDSVLLPPGTVLTGNNEMYKVFTPFRRAFIQRLMMSDCRSVPAPKARTTAAVTPSQPLAPFDYPQQPVDNQLFPAGKRRRYSVCAVFVARMLRTISSNAISPRSRAPVACHLIWHWGFFHPVNVLIVCEPNVRICWKMSRAGPLFGLMN